MKSSWLKKTKAEGPHGGDLAFLPPYSEQAKYLLLADKFLSPNGSRHNVVSIDGGKHFQRGKKTKKAV
jgi:hypothetical protein